MKIRNIFTLVVVSMFIISCAKKPVPVDAPVEEVKVVEVDDLTLLKQQTELNNPFVVEAKNQLSRFVGDKNFDNYITQRNILKCHGNTKQSECVLNFYLTEYYRLKMDSQAKKTVIEVQEAQKVSTKLDNSEENTQHYCELSTNLVNLLYTKPTSQSVAYYQQQLKLDNSQLVSLIQEIKKDSYSHFLISENATVADEMKTDYLNKCLIEPKANIINYTTIFR
ncbi:hypothetical protein PT273_00025 [Orbaceae bacterium ESL0727]|nr:hypothetical protein [Orbaceae bacterium ESL0727]